MKVGKSSGYQEIRGKLGFFGWVWRILLMIWQVAMIAWFFSYTAAVAPMVNEGGAAGTGAAIGAGISWMIILIVWAAGTVILGLFVLLTRRTRAIVPVPAQADE